MDVLSYSPHIEAYVMRYMRGGSQPVVDITDDLESCTVGRKLDSSSTFSITLANAKGKYTGMFKPMDRIAIYATKDGEPKRLLTGYISKVDRFKLFNSSLSMSGYDTLYRLQQTYWDPKLPASYWNIWYHSNSYDVSWDDFASQIRKLVVDVGGMDEESVRIGGIPEPVVNAALDMYVAQAADYSELRKVRDDIINLVSGLGFSTGGSQASGTQDGNLLNVPIGEFDDGTLSARQRAVLGAALSTPPVGMSYCAAWVSNVFANAGLGYIDASGNANDMCARWCHSYNRSDLKPGMIVAVESSSGGEMGKIYGHVGIWLGNNTVISAETTSYAYIQQRTLDGWIDVFGKIDQVRWGWLGGVKLTE